MFEGTRGHEPDRRDIEKRWDDPPEIRRATRYAVSVLAVALVAAILLGLWAYLGRSNCAASTTPVCGTADRYLLAIVPAAVLMVGGVGAFFETYAVWKRGGTWPAWQGAGWALFLLMLVCAALGAGVLAT
ncbi:hypothetical protein [Rhodococcus gannanensis]|uniref:Transmembrane protein n=1 Tax=Rhodococcus gannanensis TaxID=1960308 RepID=A0ABW4PA29_9NOCA